MQSHPIKFKCGHEKALPLDERGEDLKAKIAELASQNCCDCILKTNLENTIKLHDRLYQLARGRDER